MSKRSSSTSSIPRESSTIVVHVTPDSRRERIESRDGVFDISVKEPAQDNAANERVRELLAVYFGVAPKAVRFVSGARSRKKRFTVIR